MTYADDIVGRALRVLRVIDPDEPVPDGQFQRGVVALNSMMAAWEAIGRALGWSPVSNPKDVMPTAPEFDEAIAYNLACKLRPEYGKSLDPDVVEFAQSGLSLIRDKVAAHDYARLEYDLPRAETSLPGAISGYRGG